MVRDDGIIKVLDFGVARRTGLVDPAAADETVDNSPSWDARIVGTPAYMAPELIRADDIDGRADQFGWGVLGYELLTGRLPWKTATNFLSSLTAVMTEFVAPLSETVDSLPVEVDAAILRALAKSPDDRFPSMNAAVAELLPHGRRSVGAQRPSVAPASVRRIKHTTPPNIVCEPTVVAVAAAPHTSPTQVSPRPQASNPPPVRPSPSPPSSQVGSPRSLRGLGGSSSSPPLWPSSLRPRPASNPTDLRPAFRDPDFFAAVDVEAHLKLLPESATCKGMFFSDLLQRASSVATTTDLLGAAASSQRRYLGFRDYPIADLLRLTAAVAHRLYPDVPCGEGLRRIGQGTFGSVLGSHIGRSILGALGQDIEAIVLSAPKVLRLFVNFGEFSAEKVDFRTYFLRTRQFPAFLETFHIGVLEGALVHCNERARLRVALDDLGTGIVEVRLF